MLTRINPAFHTRVYLSCQKGEASPLTSGTDLSISQQVASHLPSRTRIQNHIPEETCGSCSNKCRNCRTDQCQMSDRKSGIDVIFGALKRNTYFGIRPISLVQYPNLEGPNTPLLGCQFPPNLNVLFQGSPSSLVGVSVLRSPLKKCVFAFAFTTNQQKDSQEGLSFWGSL